MIEIAQESGKATDQNKQIRFTRTDKLSLMLPILIMVITLLLSAISAMSPLSIRQVFVSSGGLRFFPLFGIVAAATITLLTLTPQQAVYNMWRCIKINIPISLLILISLLGASVGRFVLDQETSYFSRAFMSLAYLLSCFVFLRIPSTYWPNIRNWMFRVFIIIGLFAGLTIIVNILLGEDKAEPATVFLFTQIISVPYYFLTGMKRWLLFAVILTITFLTFKNTAVLIALVTCLGIFLMPRNNIRRISITNLVIFSLVVLTVLIILGGTYLLLDSGYSDGHADFRMAVYRTRINQFIASPFWGQLFSAETSYFYEPTRHLVPAHSDIMDLLAQGGLLGFGLFVLGVRQVTKKLFVVRRQNVSIDQTASRIISWVFLYLVAMIISFSFNSILGTPDISVFFWVGLAYAHCIGIRQERFR